MKRFKKNNVILRTNDPKKERELILRGFVEVKETQAKKSSAKKAEMKAPND